MRIRIHKNAIRSCGAREAVIDHEVIAERLPRFFVTYAVAKNYAGIPISRLTSERTRWLWHLEIQREDNRSQAWVEFKDKELSL